MINSTKQLLLLIGAESDHVFHTKHHTIKIGYPAITIGCFIVHFWYKKWYR
jgi:hypothetical protein